MEYPFGCFRSALLAVLPPRFLGSSSLTGHETLKVFPNSHYLAANKTAASYQRYFHTKSNAQLLRRKLTLSQPKQGHLLKEACVTSTATLHPAQTAITRQPLYLFSALLCDSFSIEEIFVGEAEVMSSCIGLIYQARTFPSTRHLLTVSDLRVLEMLSAASKVGWGLIWEACAAVRFCQRKDGLSYLVIGSSE